MKKKSELPEQVITPTPTPTATPTPTPTPTATPTPTPTRVPALTPNRYPDPKQAHNLSLRDATSLPHASSQTSLRGEVASWKGVYVRDSLPRTEAEAVAGGGTLNGR